MDAMLGEWQRQRICEGYDRHMQIVMEERAYYWDAKRLTNERPDESICIDCRWHGP